MTDISVVATFTPKQGQESAVEGILRGMIGPTRKEPGCLRYELYASADPEPQFVLIEAYAGQPALEAHRATDHYKSYRGRIGEALKEPIKVVVLNTIDAGK
jgi:quinol monooxygenase YgiN